MIQRRISLVLALALATSLLGGLWLAAGVMRAHAQPTTDFTVTKFEDSNDGTCDADCSLREAIIAANASPDLDTIVLPAGTYSLTLTGDDSVAAVGDLDILAPLTLSGAGAEQTIIDATLLDDRVFDVASVVEQVTLSGVSLVNGSVPSQQGGGIHCSEATLALENVTISHIELASGFAGGGVWAFGCNVTLSGTQLISNTAYQGAGIYVYSSTLSLTNSVVSGNHSAEAGAGIFSYDTALNITDSVLFGNESENSGGGIYQAGDSSTLELANSLVGENSAEGEGGGIFTAVGQWAIIENSTISGNRANTYGGGINTRIPTTITHSTIAFNVADYDQNDDGHGGGLMAYMGDAQVSLQHTLLADNVDRANSTYHDCFLLTSGLVTSQGYNLVETVGNCTIGATGDITGLDPRLGPLQENGGASWTHALLTGSPAIDAGDPAFASPPDYDQRGSGFARLVNGRVDIGAFEAWANVYLPLLLQ